MFYILFLSFFVACSTKNLSPSNVSDYFWSAQKEKNYEDAKKFVRQSDKEDVKLQNSIKIKRYEIEKAKISESKKVALVPTKVYIQGFFKNDPSSEVAVDFDTYLNKTEDGWKVNMKETKKILYSQVAKKFGSTFGGTLFKKLKEGLGDLNQFQEIFKEILEGLANSVKGVQK
jgi:hypothetical protein